MKKIMFSDKFGLTQAVLDGLKTMTRRIAPKGTPLGCWKETEAKAHFRVGEVVGIAQAYNDFYNDECDPRMFPDGAGWTNKIFVRADLMPHQIRITSVRVERLQDISDEDCIKEGIYMDECKTYFNGYAFELVRCVNNIVTAKRWYKTPREAFAALIDKVSGKGTWESNPFVFAYSFELVK